MNNEESIAKDVANFWFLIYSGSSEDILNILLSAQQHDGTYHTYLQWIRESNTMGLYLQ